MNDPVFFSRRTMLLGLTAMLAWPAWRRAHAAEGAPLRIGFQKGSVNLALLKLLGGLDKHLPGVPVQWAEFPLTRDALQVVRVREHLPAPDIVLVRRPTLPLTPAAEFLCDVMLRRADQSTGTRRRAAS